MTRVQLLAQFDTAMHGIYKRALSEANYPANIFLGMLANHGGHETARRLINSPSVSDGYTALWEKGRLDLTVEATVLENLQWHELFSDRELDICKRRLHQYGYRQEASTP